VHGAKNDNESKVRDLFGATPVPFPYSQVVMVLPQCRAMKLLLHESLTKILDCHLGLPGGIGHLRAFQQVRDRINAPFVHLPRKRYQSALNTGRAGGAGGAGGDADGAVA
jgi:hypothetical protein